MSVLLLSTDSKKLQHVMSKIHAMLLGLVLPTLVSSAAAGTGDHKAWIETSIDNGQLLAIPRLEPGHDALLQYELTSTRAGKAGRSSSKQAGSIRVMHGEVQPLTRLQLSVAGNDKYNLSLRVYEDGHLVAEDSVTYP